MIKLFINSTDVSSYLDEGSLSTIDQIRNKANTARFSLRPGVTEPSENQDVKIFDTVKLVSASGVDIVVQDKLQSGVSILDYHKFRAGQYLWLGVGIATQERVTISAIAAGSTGQVNITLTGAIVNAHSAGENAGKLVFAGTLSSVVTSNPKLLADVEYDCQATDYTKIFDRKLINDSWEDKDARYIINDALNTTINYNLELDDMEYADNTAAQAEWLESGDGGNPTISTTVILQGSSSVLLPWTNSGGTATFTASPTAQDLTEFTAPSSGSPTKGNITFWYKRSSAAGISSIGVRLGSDASNYSLVSFVPAADTDWHFISLPLKAATETGTPVWTAADYLAFVVAETTTSSIRIDDVRITADGSFTMYNFQETDSFDDVRASFKKPTIFIEGLASALSYFWYVDYEKDIHFFSEETSPSPFNVDADLAPNNFEDLRIDVDTSQLKNRQVVRGGLSTSETVYSQVVEGDNATREWILKSLFVNLTVKLDDNTSLDLAEAGTTSTTINATGHGLTTGDWIVNRTRSNAAREVTVVTANQFTVLEVTGQTNGDTFSKFATVKTVGVEYLDDEASFDYMYNFNEKSIRASTSTATLVAASFLLFTYNEKIPIRVSLSDPTSIALMKSLVGGDGVFDGAVITDESLDSTQAARDRAQAEITQFANPLVRITFKTNFEGLESGQLIRVTDTEKSVDADYLINTIRTRFTRDFPFYEVTCASTLFGIIEYFQQLSQEIRERLIDEDEVIDLIISEMTDITIAEVHAFAPSETASESATITVAETSNTATERSMTTSPYKWEPDATDNRWNLAQWG